MSSRPSRPLRERLTPPPRRSLRRKNGTDVLCYYAHLGATPARTRLGRPRPGFQTISEPSPPLIFCAMGGGMGGQVRRPPEKPSQARGLPGHYGGRSLRHSASGGVWGAFQSEEVALPSSRRAGERALETCGRVPGSGRIVSTRSQSYLPAFGRAAIPAPSAAVSPRQGRGDGWQAVQEVSSQRPSGLSLSLPRTTEPKRAGC